MPKMYIFEGTMDDLFKVLSGEMSMDEVELVNQKDANIPYVGRDEIKEELKNRMLDVMVQEFNIAATSLLDANAKEETDLHTDGGRAFLNPKLQRAFIMTSYEWLCNRDTNKMGNDIEKADYFEKYYIDTMLEVAKELNQEFTEFKDYVEETNGDEIPCMELINNKKDYVQDLMNED